MRRLALLTLLVPLACSSSPPASAGDPPHPTARPNLAPTPAPHAAAPATPAPVVAAAAAAPTAAPGPAACTTDADCGFDDPCVPKRCVAAKAPSGPTVCDKSLLPTGTCVCSANQCALKPNADHRAVTVNTACTLEDGCTLDVAAGACSPGRDPNPPAPDSFAGPRCYCDGHAPMRCTFTWLDPVPCKSDKDCWIALEPIEHPIKRPAALRKKHFRACQDGESVPTCTAGTCNLERAGC